MNRHSRLVSISGAYSRVLHYSMQAIEERHTSMLLNIRQKISERLSSYRKLISDEMQLPDIRSRHLFTVRLRIFLFIATWILFFTFFPSIWKSSPFVPLIFNVGFLVTSVCYLFVIRHNKILLSVMIVEIFADVISQTMIIYLMGVVSWAPFLIYGLYVAGAGILAGSHVSLFASTIALLCYNGLYFAIQSGWIPPFSSVFESRQFVDLEHFKPFLILCFLPIVFFVIVYSVRIANYFFKIKEDAIQKRNVQLTALSHIGATIRRALHVKNVIDEVLKAVIQGLGFDVCILALVDTKAGRINLFLPNDNYYTQRIEEILGHKHSEMYLPLNVQNNSAYLAIKRNRVLVRNNFTELVYGVIPEIPVHNALRAQKVLGFKKFVITPLVAEQRVIGAIIGASKKTYVEESVIDTLDNFANQAALAIESAQMFEALELKNLELIQANKVKSDFLAIMSHELRTPLNAVIGYTEALRDKALGDLNADQVRSLSEVMRNAGNLLELINSILDLAKIESGKMGINVEEFDLLELTQNVKSSLMPLLDKKFQVLTIHSQQGMPFISGDAVKIRQILMNLIGNAIKFTDKKGEIDVFIEYHEHAENLCHVDFAKEKVQPAVLASPAFLLRVRDTGIGVKEKDLSHIFELFRQGDSSYTRKHEGTGLGLALTKELVGLHSGFITVHSDYGKGTEFKLLFPQMSHQAS